MSQRPLSKAWPLHTSGLCGLFLGPYLCSVEILDWSREHLGNMLKPHLPCSKQTLPSSSGPSSVILDAALPFSGQCLAQPRSRKRLDIHRHCPMDCFSEFPKGQKPILTLSVFTTAPSSVLLQTWCFKNPEWSCTRTVSAAGGFLKARA